MAEAPNNLIQECPTCGALIDVAGEDPFALMHCPTCGGAMRVRRQFDHFELQEQLGSGGMGTVYRALDQNLGRQVALKLLQQEHSANPEFIAQFAKEAAVTASINHPHVVKVYSTGVDHGLVYIAMELVDKGSLDDLLAQDEKVAEVQALTTGIQIAQGLNAALQRGLIHRDVKPGNILFANAHTAKIVDFGLAVLMEHAGTVMGEVWGTPAYVAPEKLDDRPEDLRSDIYSLGATLFHALAGVPPCAVETNQMKTLLEAKRKVAGLRTVAPEVSAATAFAIDKTLKVDAAERFQTYEELIEALEFARSEVIATAQEAEAAARAAEAAARAPEKDMGWLTYVVTALVVAVGIGGYKVREHLRPRTAAEVEEEAHGGGGIDGKYQAARMLLAGSDGAKAAAAFRALEALPNVPQPRLNWITLHAGLAEFLAGRVEEGRADFAKIEGRGVFSTDPTEQRLANFFVATAKLAATGDAVPPAAVQALEPDGEEAMALLVCAAKDWALQDFAGAGALFREFSATALPAKAAWVAEYKALAAPFIADSATYVVAVAAVEGAGTLAEREAALATAEEAKTKLKLPGVPGERLAALAKDLQGKIAAEKEVLTAKMTATDAADMKALGEMKTKLFTLCQLHRYADAYALAKAVPVQGERGKKLAAAMVRKTEWLARFKATLIADLTAIGYAAPLVKKSGAQLAGGAHRANDTQVEIVSQFGTVPVPWTDLSNDCIFAMGQSFLRAALPPDKLADRAWYLGVFAFFNNKDKEGRELLIQASQTKAEYLDQLGLFIGSTEPQ